MKWTTWLHLSIMPSPLHVLSLRQPLWGLVPDGPDISTGRPIRSRPCTRRSACRRAIYALVPWWPAIRNSVTGGFHLEIFLSLPGADKERW